MSLDTDANPYAPPQEIVPAVIMETALWRIEGAELWVRNGAHFPNVDLASGEIDLEKPVLKTVQITGFRPVSFAWLALFLATIFSALYFQHHNPGLTLWPLAFVPLVATVVMLTRYMRSATVTFHESQDRESCRVAPKLARVSCAIALLLVFVAVFVPAAQEYAMAIGLSGFFLMVAGAILGNFGKTRLHVVGLSGIWFRLRGISPAVLEKLSQSSPEVGEREAGYGYFTINYLTYPWHVLCRVYGWNQAHKIALWKWTRSERFTVRTRILTALRQIPEEEISESFRTIVGRFREGFAKQGWQMATWDRELAHGSYQEDALFLHQNGYDVMIVVGIGDGELVRVVYTILYSWTMSGKILYTANNINFPHVNPQVEDCVLPGKDGNIVIAHHMRRSAAEGCIAITDWKDAVQRMIDLLKKNHAEMYRRGMCTALESNHFVS